MLMNKFGFGNMDFRKTVKLRIYFSALLIVLGALAIVIVSYFKPFSVEYGNDMSFILGFYFGVGFGLIGAGTATIIMNIRYLKNADKFKKAETAYLDERNRFVANKTWSITGFIMLVLIYLAALISGIYDIVVCRTLLVVLGTFFIVLVAVKTILGKKY